MRRRVSYRIAMGIALFAALLILWINLAVGIIGEPDDPANLMYFAVLAVGLGGAVIARLRPGGMARVLMVMALAQVLVGAVTLSTGMGFPPTPPLTYLVLNLVLIAFWIGAAKLFQHAARELAYMTSKKDLIQKLLKGIETGDPEAATVVNEAKYIQHNPRTGEGSEGIAELFVRLAKTKPRVTFVRVFEDGDFAFAHNEYDFDGVEVAFEVFRFEDGKAVEHWDNIQMKQPPNPAGRNMLDGETAITDLDRTEGNRDLVRVFVNQVLVVRRFDRLQTYIDDGLIQHMPEVADGIAALRKKLETEANGTPWIEYHQVHRVLAEGNFVLCMSEGRKDGIHSGIYDLFRLADGMIVEWWNTVSSIAPRSEWKNDNGKF